VNTLPTSIGNIDKFYIDQELPNYAQIANALAARFPRLRVGIGPARLNEHYLGADKAQIEAFISQCMGPDGLLRAVTTGPLPPIPANTPAVVPAFKPGDPIMVMVAGVGEVEALFVRALADGRIVIDLDGIQDAVEPSLVKPVGAAEPLSAKSPAVEVVPPADTTKAPAVEAVAPTPADTSTAPAAEVVPANTPEGADKPS
jgi:hypothetical protein